jgi:hypothetical protein
VSVSPISSVSVARRGLLVGGLGAILATSMWGRPRAATDTDITSDLSVHLAAINELAQAGMEEGQPNALLAKLDRALEQTVGHKLFTVLVLNEEVGQNQRYYSNQPKAYPVGGSKSIDRSSAFYRDIVLTGKPRICFNYEDIKRSFFDHELIRSLGCEKCGQLPGMLERKDDRITQLASPSRLVQRTQRRRDRSLRSAFGAGPPRYRACLAPVTLMRSRNGADETLRLRTAQIEHSTCSRRLLCELAQLGTFYRPLCTRQAG